MPNSSPAACYDWKIRIRVERACGPRWAVVPGCLLFPIMTALAPDTETRTRSAKSRKQVHDALLMRRVTTHELQNGTETPIKMTLLESRVLTGR